MCSCVTNEGDEEEEQEGEVRDKSEPKGKLSGREIGRERDFDTCKSDRSCTSVSCEIGDERWT